MSRSPLAKLPAFSFFLAFLLLFCSAPAQAAQITEYRVIREPVSDRSGKRLLAVRSFQCDGVPRLLAVDPETLLSYDLPADSLTRSGDPGADADAFRATRLARALSKYNSPPYRLQNGGAVRAETQVEGLFLTVDLCPSQRPFELELFEATAALGNGRAVPVAVMISGVWLSTHPQELSYLKEAIAAGKLAVTWVNHSYHHHYDPKVPLAENFLLAPGTDPLQEVLQAEQLLLSHGLVPSPFFRFPGLVSDEAWMKRLEELSLIPVGSDAWLAKGDTPRPGSFILVHGNGNEPKGVKLLLPILKEKSPRLLPLAAAFDAEA
uniref:Polysaccharide deacetylase n=1 Tax=Geobacter sp. (strain M21) TaxID=443144 RepID=C6E0A9_GEOSM